MRNLANKYNIEDVRRMVLKGETDILKTIYSDTIFCVSFEDNNNSNSSDTVLRIDEALEYINNKGWEGEPYHSDYCGGGSVFIYPSDLEEYAIEDIYIFYTDI